MPIQNLCCCGVAQPCIKFATPTFDIDYHCDTCQALRYTKRGVAGSSVVGNYTYSKSRYYTSAGGLANPKKFQPSVQPVVGPITLESFTYRGVTGYGWHRQGTMHLPVMHADGIQVISKLMNVHLLCGALYPTPQTSLKTPYDDGSDSWGDVRDGFVDVYLIDEEDITAAQLVNSTAPFLQAEPFQYGRVYQNTTTPLSQVMQSCDISQTHAVATHQGGGAWSWVYGIGQNNPLRTATFTDNCVQAKCGFYYTLLRMTNGTVVGYTGNTYAGGTNTTIFGGASTITHTAPAGRSYPKYACGKNHYCLVDSTGVLTMYGDNSFGQTTMPYIFDQTNPNKKTCLEIVCGDNHCVARDGSGHVHSWGSNSHGQSTTPAGASGVFTTKVFAGGNSSMVRLTSTQIGWGDNAYGQCPPSITNFIVSEIEFSETSAMYGTQPIGSTTQSLNNFGQGGYIPAGLRGGAKPSFGAANRVSGNTPAFTGLSTLGLWFVWSAPTQTQDFYTSASYPYQTSNCWRVNPSMRWLQTGLTKEQPFHKESWQEWQTGVTITGNDEFGSKAEGAVTYELVESDYSYAQLPNSTDPINKKYEVPCGNIGRATGIFYKGISETDYGCIPQGECPNNQHPNTNLTCPEDDCGVSACTYTPAGGCGTPCFNNGCIGWGDCGTGWAAQQTTSPQQYLLEYGYRAFWRGESAQNTNAYAAIVSTTPNGANPYNYTYVIKNCGQWQPDGNGGLQCGGNYCGAGTYYVTTVPTVCANKPACPCPCTSDTQRTGANISNSTYNVGVTAGSIWRPPDFTITAVQNMHFSGGFRNCAQGTNPPVLCQLCTSCAQNDYQSGGAVSWTFSDAESYPCDCFGTIDS